MYFFACFLGIRLENTSEKGIGNDFERPAERERECEGRTKGKIYEVCYRDALHLKESLYI